MHLHMQARCKKLMQRLQRYASTYALYLHGICMMQIHKNSVFALYLHGAACICKSHASPRNHLYALLCFACDFQGVETAREAGNRNSISIHLVCLPALSDWLGDCSQGETSQIWPLPPRARRYRSHQQEGCDLAHLPEGRRQTTGVQTAGPLSMID